MKIHEKISLLGKETKMKKKEEDAAASEQGCGQGRSTGVCFFLLAFQIFLLQKCIFPQLI